MMHSDSFLAAVNTSLTSSDHGTTDINFCAVSSNRLARATCLQYSTRSGILSGLNQSYGRQLTTERQTADWSGLRCSGGGGRWPGMLVTATLSGVDAFLAMSRSSSLT